MIVPANIMFRHCGDPAVRIRVAQFAAVHGFGPPTTLMNEAEWQHLRKNTLDLLVTDLIEMKHGGIR